MNREIWRVSGGLTSGPHAKVFLKYGLGLIGPGDAGAWAAERDDSEFEGGFVGHVASEAKLDDLLSASHGQTQKSSEEKRLLSAMLLAAPR